MNQDSLYFHALRRQAAARLPADFVRRVMRESDRLRNRRGNRIKLIAVTGVLCAAIAVTFHIAERNSVERQNLETWAREAAQAQALEVSL